MDYMNALAGQPDANIPNNPFWSGVNQSSREQNMLPFLRNANVQSDVETQTAQQKWADMMSPEQRALRAAEINKGTVQASEDAKTAPLLGQFAREKVQNDMSLMPQQNEVARKKLTEELRMIEGKPIHDFLSHMSNGIGEISKLPPPLQAQAYTQLKDSWQAMNPNIPLPPKFQQFTPDVIPLLYNVQSAFGNTPEVRAKLEDRRMQEEGDTARNAATNATNVRMAGMREKGDTDRERMRNDVGNVARQMYTARTVMQTAKPDSPEYKQADDMLYRMVYDQAEAATKNDEMLKSMAIAAMDPTADSKKRDEAYKAYDSRKAKLLMERLKKEKVAPSLSDVRRALPSLSESEIRRIYKESGERLRD